MTDKKSELAVVEKLLELGKKAEEYEISDTYAIYKGASVDYKMIKLYFQVRVEETLIENKSATTSITTVVEKLSSTPIITLTTPSSTSSLTSEKEKSKEKEGDSLEDEEEEDTKGKGKKEEEETLEKRVYSQLSSLIKNKETKEEAKKIAIFFNINGTSKTRTNILFVNKKAYTMNEIANLLLLKDKTTNEKERTDRRELTVERIAAAYAEETANYLKRNKKFIKIKNLDYLGFTKSFFCNEVKKDKEKAAEVYKAYLIYAKGWKGGNPKKIFR